MGLRDQTPRKVARAQGSGRTTVAASNSTPANDAPPTPPGLRRPISRARFGSVARTPIAVLRSTRSSVHATGWQWLLLERRVG